MANDKTFSQKVTRWSLIATIVIASLSGTAYLTGALIKSIKWSRSVDKDLKAIKDIAKANDHDVDALQKCERDANAALAVMRAQIEGLRHDVRRLQRKVDDLP